MQEVCQVGVKRGKKSGGRRKKCNMQEVCQVKTPCFGGVVWTREGLRALGERDWKRRFFASCAIKRWGLCG